MTTSTKIFTNLAGEFLVAAELNRRHILCSVTYGASKSADLFAFSNEGEKLVRVEVKCTDKLHGDKTAWLIGQRGLKAGDSEHIWVFVLIPRPLDKKSDDECERGQHSPRFFVLTGAEVQILGKEGHERYSRKYQAMHGEPYPEEKGVPQIKLFQIIEHEAAWYKISAALKFIPHLDNH